MNFIGGRPRPQPNAASRLALTAGFEEVAPARSQVQTSGALRSRLTAGLIERPRLDREFVEHQAWMGLQTTLVYLHLTDDGKDNGRAKLDEIAQAGDLFQNMFSKKPPANPESGESDAGKPKTGKRDSGKPKSSNRKPK